MQRISLSLFVFLVCLANASCFSNIDSLVALLDVYDSDTNRVRILNQLTEATLRSNADVARTYGEEALKLAQQLGDSEGESESYFQLTYAYLYLGLIDNAIESGQKCITLCKQINKQEREADANYLMGYLHVDKGLIQEGRTYYQSCIDLSREIEYPEGIGKGTKGLGDLFETEGEYENALESFQLNLEITLENDNKEGQMASYNDLGRILEAMGKVDVALKNYLLTLRLAEEEDNYRYMGVGSGNTGSLSFTYYGMGDLYERKGDFTRSRQFHEKSLALRKELGFKMGISSSLKAIGKLYMQSDNYRKAFIYLTKSLELAQQIGSIEEIHAAYSALARYYEEVDDFRNALAYQKLLLETSDSLFNKDQNKQFAQIQSLYETEKKEKHILAQENEILGLERSNTKITTQRNYIMAGTFAFGILGFFGFQLEKFGLTAAIEECIHKVEKSTNLFISKEIDDIDNILTDKAEIHIYRTIQEALNNLVKHANATAAKVSIQKLKSEILIKIQDNGKGFDHELTIATSKSLGLRTMYERISALGGNIKIEGNLPKGTVIEIHIPN